MSIRLHDFALSGHAHRVRLFLSLLGLPFEEVPVDLRGGEHKSAAFLSKNPFGQVPVLEDGPLTLADSNAIITYLALKYDPQRQWWPEAPAQIAEVQRWLSAAAGPLANGAAKARWTTLMGGTPDKAVLDTTRQLLLVMDQHLGGQRFLASEQHPTVADVALYSYTARVPEGGIALEDYPHVQRWLAEVEALPGFAPMPSTQPFGKPAA
ncbi:MAG: glutathione S-transferase [Leptothrix sp. (in: Bacteria)]|nr:glutathione S-transferase [Leptothrix sp. (in: b-proteobacteria)]